MPSSSTPVHAPPQYLQPGHSYPAAPYTGQHCAASPTPASLCSVNIQHTVNASYTPTSVQPNQPSGGISAPGMSQNVAQSYQSPGHLQQQTAAASSLTFPSNGQQACQNCAAPRQQGFPAPVQQQTVAAAPALQAQSYPASETQTQCHSAQAPSMLQQVHGNLSSQQPGQSSSTPALYSQQVSIPQENQQPLLQNVQSSKQQTQHVGHAYIQPQLQHSQETLHSIHQQMAQPTHYSPSLPSTAQQVHTPPQKRTQQNIQTAVQQQSHDASQSAGQQVQTPAPQILSAVATHPGYPAAGLNVLQQQTVPAQSQYLPAQSATQQTYGGVNQVVTHQILHSLPCIARALFIII